MNSNFIIRSVLVLCFIAMCHAYSDCGSEVGSVVSVEVSGCKKNQRKCILKRNTNASMEIVFKSNVDSDTLEAVVHGIILGIPAPFDLPNPDGCKDSGVECPIKAGEEYQYRTTMPILGNYPRVTVDIKWELRVGDSQDVVCVLIPAKLT